MNSFLPKMKTFALVAVLLPALVACGSNSNMGRLSLSLTDAPTLQYSAVYVTIKQIDVHVADETSDTWKTIEISGTYDLMALANGIRERLALVDMEPGHYTQMRLMLGTTADPDATNILGIKHPAANYVVDTYETLPSDPKTLCHELKIPSGYQTGIKLVHEFDINADSTTELVLDFNASKSIVVRGNSGKDPILKPTIQVATAPGTIVSGKVITPDTTSTATPPPDIALPGALVSAQFYDPNPDIDLKDQVIERTSALTLADGTYKFFIGSGTYYLVTSKLNVGVTPAEPPLGPTVVPLNAAADSLVTVPDIKVEKAAKIGTLEGTVPAIEGAAADAIVTVSVRQKVTIESVDIWIEVWSTNLLQNDTFSLQLPEGTYRAISWTPGFATVDSGDINVVAPAPTKLTILFHK